ncbi:PIN domain-containing protein [Planomonospora sp. ID82291]|uniref:PIN domain-containing protein n=1 Tax=Planomonospora sp. ID82291 TaxID=2738136 RepID=UPI0018C3F50D|nr:PIN domain-containing protein [Planomonospora sp. ID82291]MBG0815310.1 PIN domain-containing protein [Planomonospora sp. ID82291]
MTYLADTSAVWRILRRQIGEPWPHNIARGLVALCPPVEAELMVGVRADRDHEPFFAMLSRVFGWCPAVDAPWRQVLAVQRDLIKIGHHRGPSPMDIMIALTAQANGLTLIHADQDFAAIAKVRPEIMMIRIDAP